MPDASWSDRHTEPGAGCLYSEVTQSHVIVSRAGWGIRRLCVRETQDFITSTPSRVAIQIDSLDDPLDETYGMPCFAYKGWYIGLLWMYHTPAENSTKYMGGTMNCQLAYSFNGTHWLRSLRQPFIDNDLPLTKGMVFPSCVRQNVDGDILITASCTPRKHGHFAEEGAIVTYRLREDGFICLKAAKTGTLFTRQLLLGEGGLKVNARAEHMTLAIHDAQSRPIPGFSHEDCIPLAGDATVWQPRYSSGHSLSELAGQVITLEFRLQKGCLYAYSGDFVPLMNQEASRYQRFGILPDSLGF